MPIQTTYNFDHTIALVGQCSGSGISEKISAYADAAIAFGRGVVYDGANAGTESRDAGYVGSSPKVKIPTATGGVFVGVTQRIEKPTYDRPDGLTVVTGTQDSKYEIGDSITVRTKGRIWVYAEQAVNPGLSVFLRHTTNGALTAGNFRVDADTSRADAVTTARWVSRTSGAGVAELELLV